MLVFFFTEILISFFDFYHHPNISKLNFSFLFFNLYYISRYYETSEFFLATMNRVIDLEETIQKIYEQDYKKFEIVIVDNGSNDASEMIKKYDKVKYTYLKENIGAIPARNIAMKKCNGEILVSLDDDSSWEKFYNQTNANF